MGIVIEKRGTTFRKGNPLAVYNPFYLISLLFSWLFFLLLTLEAQ